MKITLHDSVPENRRPDVESLVRKHAGECTITWMPSRFPRLVILLEPQSSESAAPAGGSFFESPQPQDDTISALSETLEQKITSLLQSSP